MGLLRRAPKTPAPTSDHAWAMLEVEREGETTWLRRNVALESRAGDAEHDHLLVVTVEGDLSDPEVLAKLGGFEDALFGILGHGETCWPAGVVTRGDVRQFLLYAGDRDEVVRRLAFIRQEFPLHFEPRMQPDPGWAGYARLGDGV